jgi:DNA polymerase-3 subunit epsilon
LLQQLSGKVLVAHHAPIETEFLRQACRRLYACDVVFPSVDTLALEKRWIDRRQVTLASGGLRLAAIRDRYGLPRYPVHNALCDALATAELLLAQIAYRGGGRQVRLKHLLI